MELKKKAFEIVTPHQTYKFQSDSEKTAEEWATQLNRSMVRAKYDGGNVKVVIPIENIREVTTNLSSDFPNTIRIKSFDPGDPSSSDDEVISKLINEQNR